MSNLHEKAIAASERFLERRGYEVLSTSWEAPDGFGTIDVVAMDEDTDLCQDFGHGSSRIYAATGSSSAAGFVRSKKASMAFAGIW